jgi:ribosomal protein L28
MDSSITARTIIISRTISIHYITSTYILTNYTNTATIIRIVINNKVKRVEMASRCELTGKGKQHGNNVSFSLRRNKRVFKPNLQKKTFVVGGQKITMTLSTQAIRTLKKKGILSTPAPATK